MFESASGAGQQMYGEFRERLRIGGEFHGATSNGYEDLEFEKQFGEDEWRMLGKLLTEEVGCFKGPVKKYLLPTPYFDPNHPIPSATPFNRKRRSSNEEAEARKETRAGERHGKC